MQYQDSIQQRAHDRQIILFVNSLASAQEKEYWLNSKGMPEPEVFGKKIDLSPFNKLILAMHSEAGDYTTQAVMSQRGVKEIGLFVKKSQQGAPINWYNWDRYEKIGQEKQVINRAQYEELSAEEKRSYRQKRTRQIIYCFNPQQTTMPRAMSDKYLELVRERGGSSDRGYLEANEREFRQALGSVRRGINDNLVGIKRANGATSYYDSARDSIYMPAQNVYNNTRDYAEDLYRNVVIATGHRDRLAREGVEMKGEQASEESLRHELLIREMATAVKMIELKQPVKFSEDAKKAIPRFIERLTSDPCYIDILEKDINQTIMMIDKAERGEKIEKRNEHNDRITKELREPVGVTPEERLILLDIMSHNGMEVNIGNFPGGAADRVAFMNKYSLGYNMGEISRYCELAVAEEDTEEGRETRNALYEEAHTQASRVVERLSEKMPQFWELKHPVEISSMLVSQVDKQTKMIVVVKDKKTGIADVIVPGDARRGGYFLMPNGVKYNYGISPNEIMSSKERRETGARVFSNGAVGFKKDVIEQLVLKPKASYVRFYSTDGNLRYVTEDSYFEGKDVGIYRFDGKELLRVQTLDVERAAKECNRYHFEVSQITTNMDNEYGMYLKPMDKDAYFIKISAEDRNAFFSTAKKGNSQVLDVLRNELAQKYHSLSEKDPSLKGSLYKINDKEVDLAMIENVNVFKQGEVPHISIRLKGSTVNLPSKPLSVQHWQKIFIEKNVKDYKRALAANYFTQEIKTAQNRQAKTLFGNDNKFPEELLQQVKKLKESEKASVIVLNVEKKYLVIGDDANKVARQLNKTVFMTNTESEKSLPVLELSNEEVIKLNETENNPLRIFPINSDKNMSTSNSNIQLPTDIRKLRLTDFMKALGQEPISEDGPLKRYNAPYGDASESTLVINSETNQWRDVKTGAYGGLYDLVYEMTDFTDMKQMNQFIESKLKLGLSEKTQIESEVETDTKRGFRI